jgi:hypothetical protein
MGKTQYEYIKLIDFALESNSLQMSLFYTKMNKWPDSKKIWLYIKYHEEYSEKYLFDEQATQYVINNIEFDNSITYYISTDELTEREKIKKYLKKDFICKFDLFRIIPIGGSLYFGSYKRVMLKDNYESAKPISEEEQYYKSQK